MFVELGSSLNNLLLLPTSAYSPRENPLISKSLSSACLIYCWLRGFISLINILECGEDQNYSLLLASIIKKGGLYAFSSQLFLSILNRISLKGTVLSFSNINRWSLDKFQIPWS
jgi:hypothetical protein